MEGSAARKAAPKLSSSWAKHDSAWRDPAQVVSHWSEAGKTDPGLLTAVATGQWWRDDEFGSRVKGNLRGAADDEAGVFAAVRGRLNFRIRALGAVGAAVLAAIAGQAVAGAANASVAGAATSVTAKFTAAGSPAAAESWHVSKSMPGGPKSTAFTSVAATGKSTAWAFAGNAGREEPTAWRLQGGKWTKFTGPTTDL